MFILNEKLIQGRGGHKERAGFKYSRIFDKPNMLTQSFLDEIKKNIPKQI